jgi:serine/threonine-protein kinase
LDFGIAKTAAAGGGPETSEGRILGTPRYMAPEQANDAREVTSAADRFALGLIAFRLLCGRHYFREENPMKVLLEVSRGPSSSPSSLGSNLGSAFDDWFARACSYDPRQRFASCGEQVEALALALALPAQSVPAEVSSGRPSVPSNPEVRTEIPVPLSTATLNASTVTAGKSRRRGRRTLAWLVSAVLGAAAAAVGVAWKAWPTATAPPPAAASALSIAAASVEPAPTTTPVLQESATPPASATSEPLPIRQAPSAVAPRRSAPTSLVPPQKPDKSSKTQPKDTIWGER